MKVALGILYGIVIIACILTFIKFKKVDRSGESLYKYQSDLQPWIVWVTSKVATGGPGDVAPPPPPPCQWGRC